MVINYFDLKGVALTKYKTKPPLIIDSDAPLAGTVATKGFQPVTWW